MQFLQVGGRNFTETGQVYVFRQAQPIAGEGQTYQVDQCAHIRDGPAQLVAAEIKLRQVGECAQVGDGPAQLVGLEVQPCQVGECAQVGDRSRSTGWTQGPGLSGW